MLRYFTAGESHGEALVAFLSGLPAGLKVDQAFVDRELWRRQQGYGRGGRMKIERDTAHILSGVRQSMTIGSPVAIQLESLIHMGAWIDRSIFSRLSVPEDHLAGGILCLQLEPNVE